ncbi:MAG: gamma carbonic anhydrase family protein [Candidatus Puniceispirillaceae bacterium]
MSDKNTSSSIKMGPIIESFMGLSPEISDTAFLASSAVISGAVRIGDDANIWHNVTLRGDANYITIGQGTNIQDNSVVHIDSSQYPTIIGEKVTIGHSAVIHACTLEDRSFVGMGAIVMDGAVVQTGAMVAAGAMVTPGKTVPSGELWSGRPAKKMRELSEAEQEEITKSADRYIELGRAYRLGKSGGPYHLFTPRPLPPIDQE